MGTRSHGRPRRLPSPGVAAAAALLLLLALAAPAEARPPRRNGFTLDPRRIEVAEILPGGPARDGIPALDAPPHVPVAQSGFDDDEVVVGVALGGEARAYPVSLLVWHELVNDTLGGRPILVSFCPLCGTGMVFDRRVAAEGRPRRFGVSGLLYRSDLLLYDRETESLWSQISAEAVTGPSQGQRLTLLRSRMLPLGHWRRDHPETRVLSAETGHRRPYGTSPYAGYSSSERLHFPVRRDRRYHPKMPTLGLRLAGGPARAYPAVEVVRAGGAVEERFGGHPVRVAYDPEAQVFEVRAPQPVEVIEGFWFAWAAFHPGTGIFRAQSTGN